MNVTEPNNSPLVITLFGPMQVLIEGQPLPHMRSRKGLWLLALLALRHGRPVEREWLASTLWPDMEQSQAFANLRPILSDLRRALGSATERLHSPDRHTLQLSLHDAQVDVSAFDVAITSTNLSELEQATALYCGSLLEGCTEEWVFQERHIREHQCLQALQKLGDAALSAGNYARAADHYQQAIHIDPFWETAQRGLMEALARSGDRNAALQIYREFVKLLRDDPTAVPDKQTTALYTRLRNEARQPGNAPSVLTTQAVPPPAVTGYLPHPLTDLVGREDESLEVIARLRRSRLVTLTGLGGIGKTRLALEVARQVAQEYSDGVWLVALESLSEGKQVLSQIASVLGVKEQLGQPLQANVIQHLQGKRLLLVLDNCEHLLEASANIAQHLLQECVSLRVLATSREALGMTGETVWAVPSLAVPDPTHLPNGQTTLLRVVMSYESVQLFLERAQSMQKTFDLTGSNAQTIAQLCFRLEGIPLALELAAARIKAMTIEQIVARLDNELGLLTYGSRTAQSRQQTLRATLDWSCALLTPSERLLLSRLSVFAGGWTLEAAEQVCAGESIESAQILPLLTSLVDKSLIMFEEQEHQESGRYRLLEMVRQYASEGLQVSGEAEQVKVRHRNWLVKFAEAADLQMNGPEQEKWLRWLETEHANIRATLNWIMQEDGEETELRLVGALWRFWEIHGHCSEGRQYLRQAIERTSSHEDTSTLARALTGAAGLAFRQAEYADARELHRQSMRINQRLGNRRSVAASLANQGTVAWAQGDYMAARSLLEESLTIHREVDNRIGIAMTLDSLGHLFQYQSDFPAAQACFEESLPLKRQLGDQRGIAFALENFGNLSLLRGNPEKAKALFEESLSIRKQLGDKYGIALSLGNLGMVAKEQGNLDTAHSRFEECLSLFQDLGDRQGIALTLENLGVVAKKQGDYILAQTLLQEGLALIRQAGDRDGIASLLCNLGNVAKERGDHAAAWVSLQESLSIRQTMGNKLGLAESLEGVASVMFARTEIEQAVSLWGTAAALREAIGISLPLSQRAQYEQQTAQVRADLGEERFTVCWDNGIASPWKQVVDRLIEKSEF